tara:strand:+ start:653 stop:1684 length:1032 start_codon:yes stop_codon:yes gene_type:complete
MAFYTKVDYSRQLKQPSETTARFSGSTLMEQNLNVYSGITGDGSFSVYKPASWYEEGGAACGCSACTTGYTFVVGAYSSTSASCNVTVTAFSAVTGMSSVIALNQPPMEILSGATSNPGISASTLQINKLGLVDANLMSGVVDLQLDEDGNVVKGASSSMRYKQELRKIPDEHYNKLLDLNSYFFRYVQNGVDSFGLMAEDLHELGYKELVIYDGQGRPDNIQYKLLSVSLLSLIQNLHKNGVGVYDERREVDTVTKVITEDYTTNGEHLIVVNGECVLTLNSSKDTKVKVKSLANVIIKSDIGKIDDKWDTIDLDGDSCVELVFVKELSCWVITSSDGLKNS